MAWWVNDRAYLRPKGAGCGGPVESFFRSLKNELVRHRRVQHHAEARYAIAKYIEGFYNRQRLHQALGDRSPEEFERQESVT